MILDKGPRTITPQMELQSEDFTHDVIIKMNGDFKGLADRLRYLNALKDRLNENRWRGNDGLS